MTNTPNQDLIHRRLKAVMDRPENQSCCDCGDPKPTWASIIVPPANVPQEVSAQPMGALCCFHCSGAHRRLGVHICFVRSVTLDDWKEKEVVAIEIGGNKRVNRAFEARLSSRRAALEKPNSQSDLEMRDRFVRAKYRDRKYFDPTKYCTEKASKPIKKEPEIDPTLFHGMESVNLFSPTQINKYVNATTITTSQNIPNIHADHDKINPADEGDTTAKHQSSMEKDHVEPKSNDDPEKPVYFLPLKDTMEESKEQSVVSHGKGPSNHSRSRSNRERDERSSSRSRARRSSRSHDSSCDESSESNTGRRSLRRSHSKSPKRSTSQSRRSQLKQSRSKRHMGSNHSQEKDGSRTTSNPHRSTRGAVESTDTSAPIRRNLSGPSVANVSLTPSSVGQNGSATLIRKSSSLLSLATSSKGSNLGLSDKGHKEVSSLRNETFSAIPPSASSNQWDTLTSKFEQAQRLASEYIIQELAKIQVASQTNVKTTGSNDASRPGITRRASLSKSPPRTSLSGRRPKARHSSSPEMESKKEETSTSGRRTQEDESIMTEEGNNPSSYLSILNDESGDEDQSSKKRGQETTDDGGPTGVGGATTIRVASKYALAEMEDMQNSFQQDAEKPIRRTNRRMPTSSRSTNRGGGSISRRHQSRSRSRGSTASRSPSSSPSDRKKPQLSISRSPSTDIDSRHSASKTPPQPTGDEGDGEEFVLPLARIAGRQLERAHSHGSASRRMIRQASSRDVPGEQMTLNQKSSHNSLESRPSSRRTMDEDTKQSEDVNNNTTTGGPTNRGALRANRLRRDPLSSKSDHQARSRGRMVGRVEAANQKAAIEQSSTTETRPNRSMFARVASMSFLDELSDTIPPAAAGSVSPEVAPAVGVGVPVPTRRVDDKNSLSSASAHVSHPRSNRMLDRNGLGSASSHGINPRLLRSKTTTATTTAAKVGSGNDRVLQLFAAAGPPKDEASTSVNSDNDEGALDGNNKKSSEGPERPTKALSAAALKAMKELKEIIG